MEFAGFVAEDAPDPALEIRRMFHIPGPAAEPPVLGYETCDDRGRGSRGGTALTAVVRRDELSLITLEFLADASSSVS